MIKKLILILSLMLVASVASSVPVPFGTGGGFGGGVSTNRVIFGGAFQGGGLPTNTSATVWRQLEIDFVEFVDTAASFTVNTSEDLICNTSGGDFSEIEMLLTATMQHIDTQTRDFNVRFGTCTGCSSDVFPQLVNGDEAPGGDMLVSFHNNVNFAPIPLGAPVPIGNDECVGLMVLGAENRNVQIVSGTWNMYGGGTGEAVQASVMEGQLQALDIVQGTRGIFGYSFDGLSSSANANISTWTQLPVGIVDEFEIGSGFNVSTDRNLFCNTGSGDATVHVAGRFGLTQSGAGTRTLLLKYGRRTGEGALTDGDEISIFQDAKIFMAPGTMETIISAIIIRMDEDDCVGLMILRGDAAGGPDRDYEIDDGGFVFETRRDL